VYRRTRQMHCALSRMQRHAGPPFLHALIDAHDIALMVHAGGSAVGSRTSSALVACICVPIKAPSRCMCVMVLHGRSALLGGSVRVVRVRG